VRPTHLLAERHLLFRHGEAVAWLDLLMVGVGLVQM